MRREYHEKAPLKARLSLESPLGNADLLVVSGYYLKAVTPMPCGVGCGSVSRLKRMLNQPYVD